MYMKKHPFRSWLNSCCTLLLSMLGLSSCLYVKYGVPDNFNEKVLSGQVTNRFNEPIEGILVTKAYREGKDDFVLNEYHHTYTDANGKFAMSVPLETDSVFLVAQDVDGEKNGEYVDNFSAPILANDPATQHDIKIELLHKTDVQ